VPEGATILPTVWHLKRKPDIKTKKVKELKAQLNIDGSQMEKGCHYEWKRDVTIGETYAPVASWQSIWRLLTMTALHNNWHTVQLEFVLAFPQAPVKRDLYMMIPKRFDIDEGQRKDYVLKIHSNIYGQKQAGQEWNKYLIINKLVNKLKCVQSKHNTCVFYQELTMYTLYTNDLILAGPNQAEIDQIIKDMKAAHLDITVEGDLQACLSWSKH
jgi:hypothetical protein